MQLISKAIKNKDPISGKYCFCRLDEEKNVKMSENISPDFSWSDLPAGTKSCVLICVDDKVPSKPDNVNKEGVTVSKDLPRVDFYHWVLIDLPPTVSISEGEFSKSITAKGKKDKNSSHGTRQGLNNYTDWFKGDKDMEGDYYGYDGPCPPWNDELIHEYHFRLYALDIDKVPGLSEKFGGPEVLKAIQGHILDQTEIMGTYTLNKNLI